LAVGGWQNKPTRIPKYFYQNIYMKYFILNIIMICFAGLTIAASRPSSFAKASVDKVGHRSSKLLSTANRQPPTVNRQPSTANRQPPTGLDRAAYYKAMESESKTLVDAQISELNSAPADVKNAFLGAMIMRRAGIGGNPASKLKLFKRGRALLEGAIAKDPDNAEFRFLRLLIQENAPGVLGYKNDIQKDSEFIRKSYHSLPEDLQKTIADYNKKSKVLKLQVS
jgi:hypothetical protein